ncbi:MAG: monofunctional biosynthetic peptidoglycan transglycosylase [Thermoanaerobaculia bacterium]
MSKRILLGAVVIVSIWLAYQWMTWPDVARLATEAPRTTSFMEIRREKLRRDGKNDTLLYTWVPYGSISPSLRRAALVAEDDQFYEHGGVDMKAMQEAIRKDWAKKKISSGGSTITQQLAKNLYLSPSRNPFRKLKEYLLARSLEKHLTKKRILELYLNVVEMGERVYGAEAASRHYFKKAAADLSPRESALLAGSLPNPRIMNPASPNKRLRARQHMILSRMRRWGYLFEKEVLTSPKPAAAAPPLTATAAPATDTDLAPEWTDTAATTETTDTGVPAPAQTDTTTTR